MDPITAAITVGGQLLGGAVSTIGASGSNKRAINAQKDMQRTSIQHQTNMFDWNKEFIREMYDRQNAYNAPTAQMQRLREAGINPWSIAGAPPVQAHTPSGAPSQSGAGAGAVPVQNELAALGSSIQALSPVLAEIRQKDATTANIEADTYKKSLEAKGQKLLNIISEAEGNMKLLESQSYPEWLEWKMNRDKGQAQLFGAQKLNLDIENEMLPQKLQSQIGLSDAQALKIQMEVDQMPKILAIQEMDANTRRFQAETARMEADLKAKLLPYQQQQLSSLANNLDQATRNLLIESGIKSHQVSSALYSALASRLKYENAVTYGTPKEKAQKEYAEEMTRIFKKYGEKEANNKLWQQRLQLFQGTVSAVGEVGSSVIKNVGAGRVLKSLK